MHRPSMARRVFAPQAALPPALALAWASTSGLLALGLRQRWPALWLGATALFTLYFAGAAIRWWRRPGRDGWGALPLLAFLAPLGTVLGTLLEPAEGPPVVFLSALAISLGAALAAHVGLLALTGAPRPGAERGGAPERPLRWALGVWIVLVWLLSTADQLLRFRVFLQSGHPEDTAFLWGCFESWAGGGPLLSPWSEAWGHTALRSYLGLHFSPIVLPVFGLAKLAPRLGTLLIAQNVLLGLGLLLWARVLARQAREGRGESGGPGALWTLAIMTALPAAGAALRAELHPLLWSLPVLAGLHAAWLRRSRWGFLAAGAALFLFREDLGVVLAGYAPLAWLAGRRGRREWFWLAAPLLGLVGSAAIMLVVMPRFGTPSTAFFQSVFDSPARSFAPLVAWLLAHPAELAARLLRPGHLLLALRMATTGLGVPWGSWLWVPGAAFALLFAITKRDLLLLTMSSHYAILSLIFLGSAGFLSIWGRLRDQHPRRRAAVLLLIWALAAAQPLDLHMPPFADVRSPGRAHDEVLADLRALDLARATWVPSNLLIAAPPERAVPAHWLVLSRLDPAQPGLPDAALLPVENAEATAAWRLLSRYYRFEGPVAKGRRFDLYRLAARDARSPSPGPSAGGVSR